MDEQENEEICKHFPKVWSWNFWAVCGRGNKFFGNSIYKTNNEEKQ